MQLKMIIQEINEFNYKEKILEGQKELDAKFALIDSLISLASEKEDGERRLRFLCQKDPTAWAYTFLKDKENKRLKLWPFQDKLINDKNRFVFCTASNQIGKTWTAIIKGMHHGLYVNSASVIIISKSEDQSTAVLDEMKWMMRRSNMNFESVIDEVSNRTELHLKSPDGKGVSRIKCLPATESALSYPATLEINDEISFWENGDYIYHQVLEPRTNAMKNWKHPYLTMGQIFCISNPNGQQGIGWDLFNDDRYHNYIFCWLANPNNTYSEYKSAEKRLPSDRFDSIYAARYSSATGGFITKQEFNDAKCEDSFQIDITKPLYLGGDFAGEDTHSRDVDLSVLYGIQVESPGEENSKLKLVYCREFEPRTLKKEIYEEIARLNEEYSIAMFAYDKVAIGDSVLNDLQDRNILAEDQIEPLTYSLPNKSEVYYNLKHLFEQRKIKISGFDYFNRLQEQLLNMKFIKTPGGFIKVHGAKDLQIRRIAGREVAQFKKEVHDDHADAFANACYAARLESAIPSAEWA